MEQKYDELYHYGILGMKWGIRRYQNKDGSLTEAGKKHYGSGKSVIGDSKRIKRATDAAEVKNRLDRAQKKLNKKSTPKREEKVAKLQKMYNGLISELDEREIEYGKTQFDFKRSLSMVSAAGPFGAIGGALAGGIAGLAWATSKEGKRSEQLRKELRALNKAAKSGDAIKSKNGKNEKQPQQSKKEYYNSHKQELLTKAKEKDSWDLDFIEWTQNDPRESDTNYLLKEYSKYLDDPDKWLKNYRGR